MNTEEDKEILNVLKYNQDRSKNLLNKSENQINEMNKMINETQNLIKESEDSISKSLNVLKKYNINVNLDVKKSDNFYKKEYLDNNIKTEQNTENQSWGELISEAENYGYVNSNIEDILTQEEIAKADARYYEICKEFSEKTKLNKVDITFLFVAIGLQCARQYLLSNEKFRFKTDGDADNSIKGPLKKRAPKSFEEILFGSVPYDAITREDTESESTGLSGRTHRYRTLGHDPILGWVFGPINILSDSLTKSDFKTTYEVNNMKIGPIYKKGTFGAIEVAIEAIESNKYNLPAAIIKQAVHFGADYFTKQGLPLPFISSIDNELSKTLIDKFNIDTYSVTRGATVAVLINSIISCIHKLFYDEKKYNSMEIYEVKTRKILLLSNTIATTSNAIYVAISKDYKKLDVGGMLVTIHRIISDTRFITKIKEEFINKKLDEDIQVELDEIDRILAMI